MPELLAGRTLKTATAVLRVLKRMAVTEGGLTAEQVAEHTDKSVATAIYLLNSLVAEGFAQRSPQGRYRLIDNVNLDHVCAARSVSDDLTSAAEEAYGRTRERAYVGLRDEHSVVVHDTLGRQGQPLVPGLSPRVGGAAHALAVGKAMLAHATPDEITGYIDRYGLRSFTPTTITDPGRFRAELAHVVDRGVAVDDEEFAEGFACVAAPIFGSEGDLLGAVAISVSHEKLRQDRDNLVPMLRQIARRASGHTTLVLDATDQPESDLSEPSSRLHHV